MGASSPSPKAFGGKEALLSSLFGEVLSHGQITGLFFKIICAPSCLGKRELGVTRLLGMGWVCIGELLPVKVSAGRPFLLCCHMSALNDGLGPAGVKPVLM